MKIVIAPDSFKGSTSAAAVATAIERGVKKALDEVETTLVPMADGGEGTLDTLVAASGGRKKAVSVVGPQGKLVTAEFGLLGDGKTCVIEMANASGLCLVPPAELNPLKATTYGTGQLIREALDEGCRSFILALGGSATNDGGAGMLQALGLKLLDSEGKNISYGGEELHKVTKLDFRDFDPRVHESRFLIASDVQNPLVGTNGASYVFGPQKGATAEMVQLLDANLLHWADAVEKCIGKRLHDLPGAGAAGGIGGAFQAFFPAEMKRGVDVVIEYTGLREALADADLVITGEGQVDSQTASGKTPMGVAQAAKELNIPTLVIAGSIGKGCEALYQYGVVAVTSILNQPMSLAEAVKQTPQLLEHAAEQMMRTFFYHQLSAKREVMHYEN